jgi:hypothetical protein
MELAFARASQRSVNTLAVGNAQGVEVAAMQGEETVA